MFGGERTSHSSRILGRFSHFGYWIESLGRDRIGRVAEVSLCTAKGGGFQNAPAQKERTGGRRWELGGMGKTKCAPSDLRRKEMGPIRGIRMDIWNRQGM